MRIDKRLILKVRVVTIGRITPRVNGILDVGNIDKFSIKRATVKNDKD